MASSFGSFNRSPLGAFIKSPLGARGGIALGTWFYRDNASVNLFSSPDGINFATNGFGLTPMDVLGTRLYGRTSYSDPPYSSATNYVGTTNGLTHKVIQSGSALICMEWDSAAGGRIYRSTNGGGTWASITHPNSSSGDTFNRVCSNTIKTNTGRLLALAAEAVVGTDAGWPIYSDDDGASWSGGAPLPANGLSYSGRNFLFQRADNTLVYTRAVAPNSWAYESTDNGLTWTRTLTNLPNSWGADSVNDFGFIVGRDGNGIYGFSCKNQNNDLLVVRNDGVAGSDYTTVTDRGTGFLGAGKIYSVLPSDNKLYSSPSSDLSTWTLVVTSPTTLVLNSDRQRLVAIGQTG